jgi:hypothetical protein
MIEKTGSMSITASKFLLEGVSAIGLSYQQYCDLTKTEIEVKDPQSLTETARKRFENKKLNLHRMTRIEKHYVVKNNLKELLQRVNTLQTWMIITEAWCGDSAQNIPFIAKMAEVNPNINLKIILRDSNPEIMDLYLTNGTRSIPILVAFDEKENELFRWGPRPQEAKDLFTELKAQGFGKTVIMEKLHLWYGRNRGRNLEHEITEIIRNLLSIV